jgi:hypothetical protein
MGINGSHALPVERYYFLIFSKYKCFIVISEGVARNPHHIPYYLYPHRQIRINFRIY